MKISPLIWLGKYWDAILASLTGYLVLYFFTRHSGIGVSPDSVMYESAAIKLQSKLRFNDFTNTPLVDFPVGYPLFLAIASIIAQKTVLLIAPVLNRILFTAVIFLTAFIMHEEGKKFRLVNTGLLFLLALSPCLLEIYSMLWSETLFILLVLLFIVTLKKYFSNSSNENLVFIAIVTAFGMITRYAGITLFATGFFLLLFNGGVPAIKKRKQLLYFFLISWGPVTLNLLRNFFLAGNSTGIREKAIRTVGANIAEAGSVFAGWLPFLNGYEKAAEIVVIVILIAVSAFVVYRLLQQQFFPLGSTVIGCFFCVYVFFILGIASISRFEDLSSRLLSPVYIPLLLMLLFGVKAVLSKLLRFKKMVFILIVLIVYSGFHYAYYQQNAAAWEGIKDAGIPGYAEDSWTKSALVSYIRQNKTAFTKPVYANANDAVYFLTGIPALAIPHKEIPKQIDSFLKTPAFYLVWFTDGENNDLVSLEFIRSHKKQVDVKTMDGGSIYYFSDSTNTAKH
jgi:hypothetical protein